MSKSVVRSVKNVTKGYSSVQVKVRDATSNDAWGPTGQQMSEIAQITYNTATDFYEVMDMLDKRMNDKGKNWRHVLKSLKVLDYCLHEGSENVVSWARKNIFIIKTLREFQHIDDDGRDVGQNVRISAKELTSLILDEERLRTERKDRKNWKSRVTGLNESDNPSGGFGPGIDPPRRQPRRKGNNEQEDLEFNLALEASKNEAEEDRRRRVSSRGADDGDADLAKAIKLSQEEEELRRRQLEDANASSLFDDGPAQPAQAQPTGWNQGYQQQGAVDWTGQPLDQQQPQSTGYLNNAYSQGFQAQPTGYQNFNNPYQQPQQTGWESQYQQPQQTGFMQPQQTAFNMNNPYAQQSNGFGPQSPPPQQQQQESLHPGNNNPWSSNSNDNGLKPQPTGSNNPFASSFNKPHSNTTPAVPTLDSLAQQRAQQQTGSPFSNYSTQHPQTQPQQPQPTGLVQSPQRPVSQPRPEQDPHKANLAALLSSGDGQDTFGNTGDLRIPAQHTAPGTFINSQGTGYNRMPTQPTGGNNPFLSTQYTGMPKQQMPAQTGPVGGFGGSGGTGFGGSTNPFGSRPPPNNQQQGGNSLIDI